VIIGVSMMITVSSPTGFSITLQSSAVSLPWASHMYTVVFISVLGLTSFMQGSPTETIFGPLCTHLQFGSPKYDLTTLITHPFIIIV